MKGKSKSIPLLLVWAIALALYILGIGPAAATYSVTDLGGLGSTENLGMATSLNEKGQVTGFSFTQDSKIDAFVWLPEADYNLEAKVMHDLGYMGSLSLDGGFPLINESGQVAWIGDIPNTVTTSPTTVRRGYIWLPVSDGTLAAGTHELDIPEGNSYPDGVTHTYTDVRVLGINDAGLVIGNIEYHFTVGTSGDAYYLGGYVWDKGTATAIPTVDDPTTTTVEKYRISLVGMSPNGKMIGIAQLPSGGGFVVTCEKGTSGITVTVLIDPNTEQPIVMDPLAINDQGEIVMKGSGDLYIWLPADKGNLTAGLNYMDFSEYTGIFNLDIAGISQTGQVMGSLFRDTGTGYESVVWAWQDGEITSSYTAPQDIILGYLWGPWMHMNNSGQMATTKLIEIPDPNNPGEYLQEYHAVVWDAGEQEIQELPESPAIEGSQSIAFAINDAGQVAGVATTSSTAAYACLWNPGTEPPTLDVSTAPASGIAGTSLTFTATATDPEGGAITFGLENAPIGAKIDQTTGVFTWKPASEGSVTFNVTASDPDGGTTRKSVTIDVLPALIFGTATIAKNGKNYTVTIQITNRSASTTANTIVNAAQIDGIDTNSTLPILYGNMKAGASKQCKLQFKNVPSGPQTLWVHGTCSFGNFYTTQTVKVP